MSHLPLGPLTQLPSQNLARRATINHARKSIHQHPNANNTKKPLPFRNPVHGDDATPQFLVRSHTINDPRLHLEGEYGALMWCDGACGYDVCPGSRSGQTRQTKTVFGTPWQFRCFFFANYADDSGIGDVRMLEKQRFELRRCHCTVHQQRNDAPTPII